MIVTFWAIAFSALVTATGGIVGATSLPDSWPTKAECEAEAAKAQAYIEHTRPDLSNVQARCIPHNKLVEEEPAK